MELVDLRKRSGLTQKEAANIVGVPYRTYIRYEEEPSYVGNYKYRMIFNALMEKVDINERQGLLTINKIKEILIPVLNKHGITYCYLFGSYAKGNAKETSDVDLLVNTDITGLDFYGLIEEMRTALHKKVDLLRLKDLESDNPIVLEILKEGIRLL